MQKYRIMGHDLVLVLSFFLYLPFLQVKEKTTIEYPQLKMPKAPISFCGNNYVAWVADEKEERSRGLMNFRPLKAKEAMLFVFQEEEQLGFWMKNVPYDLDIVYFARNKKLVSQVTMKGTTPMMKEESLPNYKSEGPAMYAVEVPGGSLKKLPSDCSLSIH